MAKRKFAAVHPGVVLADYFLNALHISQIYVLLDIFSRYVVGWALACAENAGIAQALIEETCLKHGVERDSLILHSDRGSPMRAKGTAELLVDLGVAVSF